MSAVFDKINKTVRSAGKGYLVIAVLVAALLLLTYLLLLDGGQGATPGFADAERIHGQAAPAGSFGNTGPSETVNLYPYAHLEQPPAPATGITPLAVASEPIWAEHNQRLLDLEANVTALKQETKVLKEQLEHIHTAKDAVQPAVPTKPELPAPTEKPAAATVGEAVSPQTQAQTSLKASYKPHRKKRLKKLRHQPSQHQNVPRHYQFNAPIVVEAVNSWGNEKRVVVRDPKSRDLKHLRVGDNLGGWIIEGTQGKDIILHNSKGRTLLKMPGKGDAQ